MEAKFIGDPTERNVALPESFDAFGVTFERDKFAAVPKDREEKFEGNSHFEIKGQKERRETEPDPFAGLSKAQIGEALAARGVEYDPKASTAELREQLRAAPAPGLPAPPAPEE